MKPSKDYKSWNDSCKIGISMLSFFYVQDFKDVKSTCPEDVIGCIIIVLRKLCNNMYWYEKLTASLLNGFNGQKQYKFKQNLWCNVLKRWFFMSTWYFLRSEGDLVCDRKNMQSSQQLRLSRVLRLAKCCGKASLSPKIAPFFNCERENTTINQRCKSSAKVQEDPRTPWDKICGVSFELVAGNDKL